MASEKTAERDPFIAGVEAKIAAWTAVLESYRAALSLEGVALPAGVPGAPRGAGQSMALPVGVFRDKGVKEAIPIYLEASRRKQTNKEIANGLIEGGIATTSANFEATVGTALLRLKNEGVILRFSDGWDLAASYPDSLRNRLEKDAGAPSKSKRAKPRAKKVSAKDSSAAEARPRRAIKLTGPLDTEKAS